MISSFAQAFENEEFLMHESPQHDEQNILQARRFQKLSGVVRVVKAVADVVVEWLLMTPCIASAASVALAATIADASYVHARKILILLED